jgi:Predicted membrane-bound metal-dependent hydrolase (DUF457).
MNLPCHLVAGTSMASTLFMTTDILRYKDWCLFRGVTIGQFTLPKITTQMIFEPVIDFMFYTESTKGFWLYFVLCFCVFLVGTCIPDIDQKIDFIEHRTITHTMWFVLLFALLSILLPFTMWFALGIFIHLFLDNLSRCGIAFFYPFTKYRHYGKDAKVVKRTHILKLYTTGKPSEGIVCAVFTADLFFLAFFWFQVRFM